MEEPTPYEKDNNLADAENNNFNLDYNFLQPFIEKEGILIDEVQGMYNYYKLYYIPSTDQVVEYCDKRYFLDGCFNDPRYDKYREKVKKLVS
jgi:hypothetical protein